MVTLEIMDTSMSYMEMLGYKDLWMTFPVLHMGEEGKLQLAALTWQAKRSQKQAPKPEHVVLTTLRGSNIRIQNIEQFFRNGVVPVDELLDNMYPSRKETKILGGLCDSLLLSYLTTGEFEDYEYVFYLEQLYEAYNPQFKTLFNSLTMEKYRLK